MLGDKEIHKKTIEATYRNRVSKEFSKHNIKDFSEWKKIFGKDFVEYKETVKDACLRIGIKPECFLIKQLKKEPTFIAHIKSDRYRKMTDKIRSEKGAVTCQTNYGIDYLAIRGQSKRDSENKKWLKRLGVSSFSEWRVFMGEDFCSGRESLHAVAIRLGFSASTGVVMTELRKQLDFIAHINSSSYKAVSNKSAVEKRQTTMLVRYGVKHPSQSDFVQEKAHRKKVTRLKKQFGDDLSNWRSFLPKEFEAGEITFTAACKAAGIPQNGILWNLLRNLPEITAIIDATDYQDLVLTARKSRQAKIEQYLITCLNEEGFKFEKRIVNRHEFDLYSEELKVAIELNGYIYHTADFSPLDYIQPKHREYHSNKTTAAFDLGIKLYHLWYLDYEDRFWVRDKVFSLLGIKVKNEYARKLSVVEVPDLKAQQFYIQNHNQGNMKNGSKHFALLTEDFEIVSCMSVSIVMGKGINERYCVKSGYKITGGFNKLLKKVKEYLISCDVNRLVTYADRDLSPVAEDCVYFRNGFKLLGNSGCRLSYYDSNKHQLFPRTKFMKKHLGRLFPDTFNPDLTEQENLNLVGIYPVYNSGEWKFELNF